MVVEVISLELVVTFGSLVLMMVTRSLVFLCPSSLFLVLWSVFATAPWGPAPAPGLRPPGLVGATATAWVLGLLQRSGRSGASSADVLGLVSLVLIAPRRALGPWSRRLGVL